MQSVMRVVDAVECRVQNEVVSKKDVLTSSTLSSVPAAVFCIACINV